jgi:pantoate--beta-alanine ligase
MIGNGQRDAGRIKEAMERVIRSAPHAEIDYVEAVDSSTLQPLDELEGETLIALAVRIGSARLIDNIKIKV